jgi:hypothetical protein
VLLVPCGRPAKAVACPAVDLNYDFSTDIHAVKAFDADVAELFRQEKFTELDCIADSLRLSKARFSGGASKPHIFYPGVRGPEGHATDEDWEEHLEHAQGWVAAKPKSITARVALAESYASYAWYARGESTSDTVTGSGWKLFGQRLDKAKEILDEASSLEQKFPEWYAVMQEVALGQGWDRARETALFERAIAFDPSYYQFYRNHALFLAPQWNGGEGESAQFAQTMADRVGGKQGDLLYFEIAIQLVCRCENPQFARNVLAAGTQRVCGSRKEIWSVAHQSERLCVDGDQGQGSRSCGRCLQTLGRQLGQGYVGFGGFFHLQQAVGG